MLLAGFALLLVGLGFKVAAAPFHAWTPDVYDGSPSPVVAYMASGVKTAGFAGLIRVFVYGFSTYRTDWQPIVYVLAVATLLVGAVLSVSQTNVKRLLAYSSISHAGFILIGIQAANGRGRAGALFYLATYTFTVAGSFGVATIVGRTGDNAHQLSDYQGLAKPGPLVAFAFLVFLLAQAGRAVHLRLPRQVLRDRCRGRRPLVLARPGGHVVVGDLGLRLPAGGAHHVRRRRPRGRARGSPCPRGRGSPWWRPWRPPSASASCPARWSMPPRPRSPAPRASPALRRPPWWAPTPSPPAADPPTPTGPAMPRRRHHRRARAASTPAARSLSGVASRPAAVAGQGSPACGPAGRSGRTA